MTNVKVGISDNGNSVILKGIAPGTVVANSSFQKLVDGSQVSKSNVALPTTGTTEEEAP
jgi:multidrug efflux system membrane fusion protein